MHRQVGVINCGETCICVVEASSFAPKKKRKNRRWVKCLVKAEEPKQFLAKRAIRILGWARAEVADGSSRSMQVKLRAARRSQSEAAAHARNCLGCP